MEDAFGCADFSESLLEIPGIALERRNAPWRDHLERHDQYFETRKAVTPAQRAAAFSLRYQVYCLERKFEEAQSFADGQETDEFDEHSAHGVLFHRPTGEAIGTVRVVLMNSGALPVMRLLSAQNINLADHIPPTRTVEVSRFAISKNFRRRAGGDTEMGPLERKSLANFPCLSLIQFLVRQTVESGVTHWAAVMEVKLLRMLAGLGIHFQAIGTLVEHHGLRQPCYCYVPAMLEELKREQRAHWEVITNGGELHTAMLRQAAAH